MKTVHGFFFLLTLVVEGTNAFSSVVLSSSPRAWRGTNAAAAAAAAARSHHNRPRPLRLGVTDHDAVFFEQLRDAYAHCLQYYSLPTQMCTAGLFAGIGDTLAQHLSARGGSSSSSSSTFSGSADSKKTTHDAWRTVHFVLKGLGGGFLWSTWFLVSDPISLVVTESLVGSIPPPPPPHIMEDALQYYYYYYNYPSLFHHATKVAVCVALEQCVVSPTFFVLWDIPVPALLSGSPWRQVPAHIRSKIGPMWMANAKVWTPANIVTYSLPSEYRVLFASMTDLIWQAVCSQIVTSEIIVPDKVGVSAFVATDAANVEQPNGAAVAAMESQQGSLEQVSR